MRQCSKRLDPSEHLHVPGSWSFRRFLRPPLAAILLALSPLGNGDAAAQMIAPAIDGDSAVLRLVETLAIEIQTLDRTERGADEAGRITTRAAINCRIIAAESLERGDAAGRRGSITVMLGFTLARQRESIDAALAGIRERAPRHDDAVLALLEQFNDTSVVRAADLRESDARRLEVTLAQVMTPLARALETETGVRVVSHWIRDAGTEAERPGSGVARVEALRARVTRADLREETRAVLNAWIERAKRAVGSAESGGVVETQCGQIEVALAHATTVVAATWMDDDLRAARLDVLHDVVTRLADPETRDDGLVRLERLSSVTGIITRLTELADRQVGVRSLGSAVVPRGPPDVPGRSAAYVARITAVLDGMIAYRVRSRPDLPRDFTSTYGRLDRAYLAAESGLFAALPRLARDPQTWSDPAFVSLVADQRQHLRDLERVALVPQWLKAVKRMHPVAASAFRDHVRRECRRLLDTHRRDDAVRVLERLDKELTAFSRLAVEDALAAGLPAVISATGGLHEQLQRSVETSRRSWIEARARGRPAEEQTDRMWQLHELALALADGIDLPEAEGVELLLNRWAAWETPAALLHRGTGDLAARLKLATAAAVNDDRASLRAELDALDRELPLTRLIGALMHRHGVALESLPDGATAAVGQVAHAVPSDAWRPDLRAPLADLCRYAGELVHAESEGREEDAKSLRAIVNDLARTLAEELG